MSRPISLGAWFLMICLSACGGTESKAPSTPTSPATPTTPPPPALPIAASGPNWSFRFEGLSDAGITGPYGKTAPLTALEGSLNASGESVTAVMQPFGRCLFGDGNRVYFTGTRSGGTIEMVSQAAQGEVVRINATLSAAGETLQGTYTITGTCGAGKTGQMIGRRVDWTGIWTGTIGAIPAVFDMQMASTPDGEANYVLSGTVTFSNTQCFPKAVITRRARGRVAFPDVVGDTQRLEIIAEISEDLSSMFINSVLVAGTCPELSFSSGRLVRQ